MRPAPAQDALTDRRASGPSRLGRAYSLLSLAGVLATAVALAVLYRELSIRTIIEFGEQSNASIASAAVNALFPELAALLTEDSTVDSAETVQRLPRGLQRLVDGAPRTTSVERIKIFNTKGIVLWSSLVHEIGADHSDNPRFQAAMRGELFSELRYHDVFDLLGRSTSEDNLIETYVPIYQPGRRRPIGVFEVYSDVDPMVRAMSRNELVIILGTSLIMLLLYGLLSYARHRFEKVVIAQRQAIMFRTEQLENVSARLMAAEEADRRRIAFALHEEVAQDLSAAKFKLEAERAGIAAGSGLAAVRPADDGAIRLLQGAIRDVCGLATELRPSSLDDFGLIATTRSLCLDAERMAGDMRIQLEIGVPEEQIPDGLKLVVFRILQQSLRILADIHGVAHVTVILRRSPALELVMEFDCVGGFADTAEETGTRVELPEITAPWSRAILSGGTIEMMRLGRGRCRCLAAWHT